MRSLGLLVRTYPNKTGEELLKIQKEEELEETKAFEKLFKKRLELVNDYNENGAYFKSTFGLDQYRYDRFLNLSLNKEGGITCDVVSIVGFYRGTSTPNNELRLERKFEQYKNFDLYSPKEENRITEGEFNKASNYLTKTFTKFWGLIDKSKFN